MVSNVDLSNPIKMQQFLNWKENDGTKQGLENISNDELKNIDPEIGDKLNDFSKEYGSKKPKKDRM